MLRHARREANIECCGLLAGRDGVITGFFRRRNFSFEPHILRNRSPRIISDLPDLRSGKPGAPGPISFHPSTENVPSPRTSSKPAIPTRRISSCRCGRTRRILSAPFRSATARGRTRNYRDDFLAGIVEKHGFQHRGHRENTEIRGPGKCNPERCVQPWTFHLLLSFFSVPSASSVLKSFGFYAVDFTGSPATTER